MKSLFNSSRTLFQTLIQLFSFAVFTLIFFLTTYPLIPGLPHDLFLRLDPLLSLSGWLGPGEVPGAVWFCLPILLVTLLSGRIFCGYLCPLGSVVDITGPTSGRGKRAGKDAADRSRKMRTLKYYLLIAILFSGFLGFTLGYALDPISLLTRSFTGIVFPVSVWLLNLILDLSRPLAGRLGLIDLAHASYPQPLSAQNFLIFLVFLGVLVLSCLTPRFWCRYLCPLGALLAALSRFAPIRRRVGVDCTECGRCQQTCPMGAIPADPRETFKAECTGCRACARACPESVISFGLAGGKKESFPESVNLSRRGFICSAGMGITLAVLGRTSLARAEKGANLIRPPGALPEPEFLSACVRCGECVKSCITNTLQPSFLEAGVSGLWTPRHEMRRAGCEQSCNVCGEVCPTGAIRALSPEEKKHARIGTAAFRRELCIAWEEDRLCLVCDESCPYNAIVFRTAEGKKRPFLDESKCNGCGICEKVCPIAGGSAIRVYPRGEIRLRRGSYVEEARRLNLEFQTKALKDTFGEELEIP